MLSPYFLRPIRRYPVPPPLLRRRRSIGSQPVRSPTTPLSDGSVPSSPNPAKRKHGRIPKIRINDKHRPSPTSSGPPFDRSFPQSFADTGDSSRADVDWDTQRYASCWPVAYTEDSNQGLNDSYHDFAGRSGSDENDWVSLDTDLSSDVDGSSSLSTFLTRWPVTMISGWALLALIGGTLLLVRPNGV